MMFGHGHALYDAYQAERGRRLRAEGDEYAPLHEPRAYDGRTWEDLGDHAEDHRRDAAEDRNGIDEEDE